MLLRVEPAVPLKNDMRAQHLETLLLVEDKQQIAYNHIIAQTLRTVFSLCIATEKSSLVNVDPKAFCGFNPCDFSKCLLAPLGSCVSDYKCRPVFFDEKSKRVEDCVGMMFGCTLEWFLV